MTTKRSLTSPRPIKRESTQMRSIKMGMTYKTTPSREITSRPINRKIFWIINIYSNIKSWWSFKLDFESELNILCIWILVIKFSYFSDYGHSSHVDGRGKWTWNKFLQPEVLTVAVPLHGRLSLGPVIIDYVSIQWCVWYWKKSINLYFKNTILKWCFWPIYSNICLQ